MSTVVISGPGSRAESLRRLLHEEGHQVRAVADGRAALHAARDEVVDLLLLDTPSSVSGAGEICSNLRISGGPPVIIMSGSDAEATRVAALEDGATDCVGTSVSDRELLARVHAVLRRCGHRTARRGGVVLAAGPVRMNVEAHTVTVHDRVVPLALVEFSVLEVLLRNAGELVTREELARAVWGDPRQVTPSTVTAHVKRLRRKIEDTPQRPIRLVTVRGRGYKLLKAHC